jgi:site-specific DNA-cytosine methylase
MPPHDLTHASFFSGVGGTDIGLERAGWRTVSFSEVDPYACAVLAERWPGVPNVGDITRLAQSVGLAGSAHPAPSRDGGRAGDDASPPWNGASLWSGGFPCQDLSVAGKRAGFTGERSVLAFAFLDLVERHRPPAVLLENVPGLLSSNRGRDMATLLGRMAELGYGVAYRVLDAQHFGVPQRRRRVFILGLRSDPDDADGRVAAERAAAVLSVGARCGRHPATGHEAGPGAAAGTTASAISASAGHHGHSSPRGDGSDNLIGTVPAALGHHGDTLGQEALSNGFLQLSPPPDADRVREADGLAGRPHDREQLAFVKSARAQTADDDESWIEGRVMPTLNSFDVGDTRATALAVAATLNSGGNDGGFRTEPGEHLTLGSGMSDDAMLPLGLDSHRYRCCGNGVVAPVAEWLGRRIAEALA